MAVGFLDSNEFSTVGTCTWVAQISRALARHAGVAPDDEHELGEANSVFIDHGPEVECDFGIPFQLDQNIVDTDMSLNLGHYFDFAQSYYPPPHGARGL
ncbi:C6 finger domain protein [Penicillium angulare]|uniref:C6 finger domain protein n=1 Tax=Penicillium angulare TaxID=116970 RepID=A0A9W9KRL8_9EURO|nr:C6 finger domain protein [Penicillium angulare]